jgi:DNA adenine methylase
MFSDSCSTGERDVQQIAEDPRGLATLADKAGELASMDRIEEVKDFHDKAETVLHHCRQLYRDLEIQIDKLNGAAEWVLRSKRRFGELLAEEIRPGRTKKSSLKGRISLGDLQLTYNDSSRLQQIAGIPEPEFERFIADTKEAGDELTTVGALRLAKQLNAREPDPKPWTLDIAEARLNNFVGSLLEKSPGDYRGPLSAQLRSLSEAIKPEPGEDAAPAIRIVSAEEPIAPAGRLRSPFPWFGSKAKVWAEVWARLGDVPNYVEPFAGSLAVLLARPHAPQIETANDINSFVANFFRSVVRDPEGVADHCRQPVNEADLHARHWWLTNSEEAQAFRKAMRKDPDKYDAKIAGWWVWGQCNWIGSGWCEHADAVDIDPKVERPPRQARPDLGGSGKGVVSLARSSTPGRDKLMEYLLALAERLRNVRVCCGDWSRICGPAPTTGLGQTAVFLDPPYLTSAGRYPELYASDSRTVAVKVRDWAAEHGDDPEFRIALCGYEGEHEMPGSWECHSWEAPAGYAAPRRNGTNDNAARERIWFSPHCLKPTRSRGLFDSLSSDDSTSIAEGA